MRTYKLINYLFYLGMLMLFVACGDDDSPELIEIQVSNVEVTIDENPVNGASLGTVQASTNRGEINYSLSNQSPAGALAINATTGELTVANVVVFDFETNPTLTAMVDASVGSVSESAAITITLNNVVEAVNANPFTVTIDENPSNGSLLGSISVTTDASELTYSLVTNNAAAGETPQAFAIDTNTAELSVADSTFFDFETRPEVTARYIARDANGSLEAEGNIQIELNDIDEISPDAFVLTYRTTSASESITLSVSTNYTYDFNVDWGDGTVDSNQTGQVSHIFTTAGDHQISITGTYPAFNPGDQSNADKLISVDQWGNQVWLTMEGAFSRCNNLLTVSADAPNLSQVTSMQGMFNGASNFNSDISHWNVSNVTDMSNMFNEASTFNQPLNSWNMSLVTNVNSMFRGANAFNQNLNDWDMSNVVTVANMFQGNSGFNAAIGNWDMGRVTNMSAMFSQASAFNQDISGWDVSSVTNMSFTFSMANRFNQDLTDWNVSNVRNMQAMFQRSLFNQDISGWDTSRVTNMSFMFSLSNSFNQDLTGWNVQNVTNCTRFRQASALLPANVPNFTNCSQ